MSDSLGPHELQHARPPHPSPTPGVHQTYIHRVGDAIQPSHPLSSHSPPAPNPSQHQSLFQWVNSLHEVAETGVSALASFLPKNTQYWSPLEWTGWISLQSKGLSRVFSNTTLVKHNYTLFFLCFPSFLPSRNNAMATLFWLCSCCLKKSYLQDAALLGFSIQHKVRQFFPQDGFDCISSV